MVNDDELGVERRDPALWLTIRREERRNAMRQSQIALFTLTQDAKEGQAAFQQKRKPQWKGC